MNSKLIKAGIFPFVLIIIWETVFLLGVVNPLFLPSPISVFEKLFAVVVSGELLQDFLYTIYRTLFTFIVSSVLGIITGIIIGVNKKFYDSLEFTIDFLRSVPATALFPLFILFLGVGDVAKISVAIFSSYFIILINTALGVRNCTRTRYNMSVIFGANLYQRFFKIILPEALPQIFVGLRTAISNSLVIIVVTEMFIGTNVGLGFKINDAQLAYRTAEMYAVILITGGVGYFINKMFSVLDNRFIHWKN